MFKEQAKDERTNVQDWGGETKLDAGCLTASREISSSPASYITSDMPARRTRRTNERANKAYELLGVKYSPVGRGNLW